MDAFSRNKQIPKIGTIILDKSLGWRPVYFRQVLCFVGLGVIFWTFWTPENIRNQKTSKIVMIPMFFVTSTRQKLHRCSFGTALAVSFYSSVLTVVDPFGVWIMQNSYPHSHFWKSALPMHKFQLNPRRFLTIPKSTDRLALQKQCFSLPRMVFKNRVFAEGVSSTAKSRAPRWARSKKKFASCPAWGS